MATDEELMGMSNEEFKDYSKQEVQKKRQKIRVLKGKINQRIQQRQSVIKQLAAAIGGKKKKKEKKSKHFFIKRYIAVTAPTKRVFDPIADQTQNTFFKKREKREIYLGKI